MSIGRSFFVGAEPTKRWGPFAVFDRKKANEIAVRETRQLGITRIDDGDRLVGGLSGGERQALAIARAVHFGASVLILDEPTAALGVKEAAHVLRIVLQARQKGIAVIFITHQVVHALTVGDHFAVLIRGVQGSRLPQGRENPRRDHGPHGRRRGNGRARRRDRKLHGDPRRPSAAGRRMNPASRSRSALARRAVLPAPVASHAGAGVSIPIGLVRASHDVATCH